LVKPLFSKEENNVYITLLEVY